MGTGLLAGAAWLLSVAVLALPSAWLGPGSRPWLCLLPWIALLGVPRAARSSGAPGSSPLASLAFMTALCLPPLGLAIGLDRAAGGRAAPAAWVAALALLLALAGAAEIGARRAPPWPHAGLWILLVPGLPLLSAATCLGGGRPARWLRSAGELSPVQWIWSRASASAGDIPWGPLATCSILGLSVLLARRPDGS